MALMAMAAGTGLTSSASHPYCIFVDGLDVAKEAGAAGALFGVDVDSVELNETIGQPSAMSFVIDDPANELSFRKNADVYFCDHHGRQDTSGGWLTEDLFRGFIKSLIKRPNPSGGGSTWTVDAIGLEAVLDKRVLTTGLFASGMNALAAMQQLLGNCDPRISALAQDPGAQTVARLNASDLPIANNLMASGRTGSTLTAPIALAGKTYRKVAEAISAATSDITGLVNVAQSYEVVDVDVQGRVRWVPVMGQAPFTSIYEGTGAQVAPYDTRPAPERISADSDLTKLINAVYVRGVDGTSSGWILDASSIGTYGRIEAFLDAPNAIDSTTRDAIGAAFLIEHRILERIQFDLSSDHDDFTPTPTAVLFRTRGGWHARVSALISSSSGLWTQGSFPMQSVTWRFSGGGAHIDLTLNFVGAGKAGATAIASAMGSLEDSAKNWIKIPGALEEVAVRTKAGIPTDADFDVPRDGFVVVDTTSSAIWFRDGGSWIDVVTDRPGIPTALPQQAVASADLTLTTAYQDVAGCTLTITPSVPETWLVMGTFGFYASVAGTGFLYGQLLLDGVAQSGIAEGIYKTINMQYSPQSWLLSVSAASHTIKLQAKKDVADGTVVARQTGTKITVVRFAT